MYTDTDIPAEMLWIAIAALVIMLITLIAWAVYAVYQHVLRTKAERQYNVIIPHEVRVKRSSERHRTGILVLAYPEWERPKKDGTRDLRTNNTRINRRCSILLINQWEFSGKNPFIFYDFVLDMRNHGARIERCHEERAKGKAALRTMQARQQMVDIDGIINRFKDAPTDFEAFCADMFRHLGWTAQVTPPSRDGGFDLKLRDPDGITYIAECKCYDRKHHVGRPIVQKLQGANLVEHAQRTLLITTSSFSANAAEYAQQVGMRLISGDELVSLCAKAFGNTSSATVPESAFILTRANIMSHIPADMRYMY